MTYAPSTITYSSVVSRDHVNIVLTLAALNDVELNTADIKNLYLTAPVLKQVWTTLGHESVADCGKKTIVIRVIYRFKSAGAVFRNHLDYFMVTLGYKPCLADQDLWFKSEVRP